MLQKALKRNYRVSKLHYIIQMIESMQILPVMIERATWNFT